MGYRTIPLTWNDEPSNLRVEGFFVLGLDTSRIVAYTWGMNRAEIHEIALAILAGSDLLDSEDAEELAQQISEELSV